MKIVDVFHNHDLPLLRRFYTELMIRCFPIEDQREDLEVWEGVLSQDSIPEWGSEMHFLIAQSEEDIIVGGCVFEFYPRSKTGLIAYLVVNPEHRGQGIARRLLQTAHDAISDTLSKLRQAEKDQEKSNIPNHIALFAETNALGIEDGLMSSQERHTVLRRLGFKMLQMDYTQPPISAFGNPCSDLYLLGYDSSTLPTETEDDVVNSTPLPRTLMPKESIKGFVRDIYSSVFGEDTAFLKTPNYVHLLQQLDNIRPGKDSLVLQDLPWTR
eukprot:GILI01039755.1.p1 GENE.GILI01039755.1~~GILI01039755.1.p1  ORF type:complete len:270 (+),score=11.15 GILI01039755.1:123-932(+)